MKAIGRHFWRLLFPQRLPALRSPALVIHPFVPPHQKEKNHVQDQRPAEKTRRA